MKKRGQIGLGINHRYGPLFRRPFFFLRLERKAEMAVRANRQNIRRFPDWWKKIAAENFHRHAPGKGREIDHDRLRKARKIGDHENGLGLVTPEEDEHLRIVRVEKLKRAA
jgi:hypothetical protein